MPASSWHTVFRCFFLHHRHTAFIDSIKKHFDITVILQHSDQTDDLIFFKVIKQTASRYKKRCSRAGSADLCDPVPSKSICSDVFFSVCFLQQAFSVFDCIGKVDTIPSGPAVIAAMIGRLQPAAKLYNDPVELTADKLAIANYESIVPPDSACLNG